MAKKSASYRIEEEQLKMLDKLVEYYSMASTYVTNLNQVKVSKATVIETLIKDKYHEVFSQNAPKTHKKNTTQTE